MKIAIIGTHFSGKTNLVNEVYDYLHGVHGDVARVSEVVRRCPLPVNDRTTFEAQSWILMQQIKEETEKSVHSIIISDRSVIDNYIYMMRKFPGEAAAFLPLVLEHAKTYDFIFKTVPADMEIHDDGFRDTGPGFREEIEGMLSEFLAEHGIMHYLLPAENRASFVLDTLGPALKDFNQSNKE